MKHLSSYYSNNQKRRAEVHRYDDEHTYVAIMVDENDVETRTYYDNVDAAEDMAEDFVEKA